MQVSKFNNKCHYLKSNSRVLIDFHASQTKQIPFRMEEEILKFHVIISESHGLLKNIMTTLN